MEIILF